MKIKNIIKNVLIIGIPFFILIQILLFYRIPLQVNNKSDTLELELMLQKHLNADSVNITYIGPIITKGKNKYQIIKYTFPNSDLDNTIEHKAIIKIKEVNLKYHVDSIIQK